jgi:3-dehydroquinate dehydratase II
MGKPYILLVSGPNLNRLGVRRPEIYGHQTLPDVIALVEHTADVYDIGVVNFQSNHEGALIDFIQARGPGASGILVNPGAFGHYSYALRDCIEDVNRPTIEIHISNVHKRDAFRHRLVLADVVMGQVVGLGIDGYRLATDALCKHISKGQLVDNEVSDNEVVEGTS